MLLFYCQISFRTIKALDKEKHPELTGGDDGCWQGDPRVSKVGGCERGVSTL